MGLKISKKQEDSDAERNPLLNDAEEEFEFTEEDYGVDIRSLDYSMIPQQCLPFDDSALKRLIPGCKLQLTVEDVFTRNERNWYILKLEHGCFAWSLQRRFTDCMYLHQQLKVYRAFLSMQIPAITLERNDEGRRSIVAIRTIQVPKLPAFPSNGTDIEQEKAALNNYFRNILRIPCFRDFYKTLEFLEIGPFSFIEELGDIKGKEGFVKRRSNCGDTLPGMMCTVACGFWKKRWLFVKENFLALVVPSRGKLECVMLLDKAFKTKSGQMLTGRSDVIVVQNLNKKLIMQCDSAQEADGWANELMFALDRGSSDFVSPNRYESFAPPRPLSECKWIVDGATYFEAVAVAMEAATEEIFIADWWLSPEIYLKRPITRGHYWQLDYLLRRKAREGVKIYVLLYKELELALGINSYHTERKLSRMHPNIQVLRHPKGTMGISLWAHHEKIVCIDQTYAFVGGIDLCYGRWDDYQHRLTDLGDIQEKMRVERHRSIFSRSSATELLDRRTSSVPKLAEMLEIEPIMKEEDDEYEEEEKDRGSEGEETTTSEMTEESPKLKNILRKYQATKMFENIKRKLSCEELGQGESSENLSSFDEPDNLHRHFFQQLGLERKFRLWHGKDYVNFISKDFQELDKPYSDMVDRNTTPRMPWHDVGIYLQGMAARDIARHFILRWNHAKEEIRPKDILKPYLMPKRYSSLLEPPNILQSTVGLLYRAECQVLRSLGYWSSNISETEFSIHTAYINVIRAAKKFIYIENQFFISQPRGYGIVTNEIADALFSRILKAHRERTNFRVYVILPLLPAFEGEVGTDTGTLIQAITYWNYKSICRGPYSLMDRLSRHMKNPSKYIEFYGLRTHGTLGNKPVTELVYVHSKILIADDQTAIIGSANINDRSLLGSRDSEIAVLVKDTNFLEKPGGAGQFCYSLRTALFREHLGLMNKMNSEIDLSDPSNPAFYKNIWNKTAESNTKIYEEVFHCLPTNNVATFANLKDYLNRSSLADVQPFAAAEKLKSIQGYLVQFPLDFLCNERLQPHHTTKEHYLPSYIFT